MGSPRWLLLCFVSGFFGAMALFALAADVALLSVPFGAVAAGAGWLAYEEDARG
jgi:hypothetical protein